MLLYTRGLPGSGKSTWAREFQLTNDNTVLVSRDDIRLMLFPGESYEYTRANEDLVTSVWACAIQMALSEGRTVVVHDTNFDPRPIKALTEIADYFGVELECKDFTCVPVEECVKNDSERSGRAHVGAKVIHRMAAKWLTYE